MCVLDVVLMLHTDTFFINKTKLSFEFLPGFKVFDFLGEGARVT